MSRGGFVAGMMRARQIVLTLAGVSRAQDYGETARALEAAGDAIRAEADQEPTEPRIDCCEGCGRPRGR